MNLATTQIMYAASSPQFNHVGAGLVPAHKAELNCATTLSAQFHIPEPVSKYQSRFIRDKVLNVLSGGISCLDYFIFRLFQALILFGSVLSLPKEFRAWGFRISDEGFIRSYAEDYFFSGRGPYRCTIFEEVRYR
jgi:hypothetical protein